MEEKDKIRQRLELLKMARDLLNENYINKRAEDHNKWVVENDAMWRTWRRQAPYPPFAEYPTDEDIVKAARNLYKFIYEEDSTETVEKSFTSPAEQETYDFLKKVNEDLPPADAESVVPETVEIAESVELLDVVVDENAADTTVDSLDDKAEPSQPVARTLPSWLRRTLL